MKTFKWFNGIKSRQELKARYKELIKQNHPDCGGNEQDMKEINNEYDELFKTLPELNSKTGETYYKKEENQKERPEDFRNALYAVIRFTDIEIEICGDWIWLHGNTFIHKDEIKAAGYNFSSSKKSWYWHDADYVKKNRKHYSMEEIRAMHGSEYIKPEEQDKLTA